MNCYERPHQTNRNCRLISFLIKWKEKEKRINDYELLWTTSTNKQELLFNKYFDFKNQLKKKRREYDYELLWKISTNNTNCSELRF